MGDTVRTYETIMVDRERVQGTIRALCEELQTAAGRGRADREKAMEAAWSTYKGLGEELDRLEE